MNGKMLSTLFCLLLLFNILIPTNSEDGAVSPDILKSSSGESISSQTLEPESVAFTPNLGQVSDASIMFYTSSRNAAFGLSTVYIYNWERPESGAMRDVMGMDSPPKPLRGSAVKLTFPGSNSVMPVGNDAAPYRSNYIMGNNTDGWHTGIVNYREIIYKNLWDGVDLVYRIEKGALKYDIIVHPYADMSQVRIMAEGQNGMTISDDGSLELSMGENIIIRDAGLNVFYSNDREESIPAGFKLLGNGTYSFDIPSRDPARTMIIDPLIYSTFLGGGGFDCAMDVAVGNDGCTYVTGYTDSLNFPTVPGAFDLQYHGYTHDAFVTKMSQDGTSIIYSTYLGDTAGDYAQAIVVDDAGCAYISGYAMSYGYPVTPGAYQTIHAGEIDGFITKISPSGDALVYSSFIGGEFDDYARGIAIDVNGFAYVLGDTRSLGFPITPKAVIGTFHGQLYSDERDNVLLPELFVTKFGQSGDSLGYSTFIGHDGSDVAGDIAVDGKGYAYVTGHTTSTSYPRSNPAFDDTHNGAQDVLVTKLSQTGSSIIYSTLLGGPGIDVGCGIEVTASGEAYVTGYTSSPAFPTTPNAFDTIHNGIIDAFVTRLGSNGNWLVYSTFIGGSGYDYGNDLTIDPSGCAYITGLTSSINFPTTSGSFNASYNGGQDAFMSKLSTSGNALLHSTYMGGTGRDSGNGIDMGADGFAYVVGETASADYPTTPGANDTDFNGNSDAFVTKFDITPPIANAGWDQQIGEGNILYIDGSGSTDNHGIVNYTWTFHDGSENFTIYFASLQHRFMTPGIFDITLNVTDATGNWGSDAMTLTVLDTTVPVAAAGPDILADEDTSVTFNGSGSTDNVGITNYTWSFTQGSVAVKLFGQSPRHVFAMPGTYSITLVVRDAAGNTGTDTVRADIADITVPTANAGRDKAVYKDSDFTFNGTASRDNVKIVDYAWRFFDGISDIILSGATPSHHFTIPGVYLVTLDVTDGAGLADSDAMYLSVLETTPPVAEAGPDITCHELEPMHFDGSGCTDNVGVAEWVWSFNDGSNNVTAYGASASWIFTKPGVYDVTLTALDAAGNLDTDTLVLTVTDVMQPTAIPGGNQIVNAGAAVAFDGSGSFDSSGIVNYSWAFVYNGTTITLYGPVQSFQFSAPGTYEVTLTVWDATGKNASSEITIMALPASADDAAWVDGFIWLLAGTAAILALIAVIMLVKLRRGAGRP